MEIIITPNDLFYYNDNNKYYRLLIVLTNKKNYWVFGSILTNKNNMIFNGENGSVTFFKIKRLLNLSSFANFLLFILLIMNLIGLYFTLRIYCFKIINKKNKDNANLQVNLI